MTSDEHKLFYSLKEHELMAIVIKGEARGEPLEGQLAVGCVIRNRVQRKHKQYRDVILAPKQFSCFNDDDPNLQYCKAMAEHIRTTACREARWLAMGVVCDVCEDYSNGATHYHTIGIKPYWAPSMKLVKQIGHHIFYMETL